MADDWFKVNMDIFGNRKIKHLRRLPNGDSIALFWIALLSEARRCNSDGKIFLTERTPYTADALAEDLKFEECTVQSALDAFEQLDMIHRDNGFITIAGWEDHQNAEGLAKIRESKRLAQARWRAKQKELPEASTVDSTVDSTRYLVDDAEEDIEEEIEIDKDNKKESVTCKQVVALYHEICISFPKIRSVSSARAKAIKARLNTYSLEDFRTVFEKAEASSFLKGSNDRNWRADLDFILRDAKFVKILEGFYDDKGKPTGRKEKLPGWFNKPFEVGSAEMENIRQVMSEADQEEAEQLRRELQESFGRKE